MSDTRVVITGYGLCSPIGNSMDAVMDSLQTLRHGIEHMPHWDKVGQLATRLAAPVHGVEKSDFPRKKIRTMGRVAILSAFASDRAVASPIPAASRSTAAPTEATRRWPARPSRPARTAARWMSSGRRT